MGFLWTLLIGFITGLIARAIKPGKDKMGIILTTVLGIAGAMFAAFVGRFLNVYAPNEPVGMLAAVLGAIVILYIVSYIRNK